MRYLIMALLLICNVSKAQNLDQTTQVEENKTDKEASSRKIPEIIDKENQESQKIQKDQEISLPKPQGIDDQDIQGNKEENISSQKRPKLTFLPGAPKYTGQYYKRHYRKAIKLREFKVGKKYCLWNSENWDDECQDAAMEYAFGENWREFKKVALDFVEYVNEMDIENVEKLFVDEGFYSFFELFVVKGRYHTYGAIHCSQAKETKETYYPSPSHVWKHISERRILRWQDGLGETDYKNFLIVKYDNFWTYKIKLSKNIIITFRTLDEEHKLISFHRYSDGTFTIYPYEKRFTKNIYHLIPKIELVEKYIPPNT